MDGASGIEMMAAIHDISPQGCDVEAEGERIIHAPPSSARMLTQAYINALR
jgi:hypothetical protein